MTTGDEFPKNNSENNGTEWEILMKSEDEPEEESDDEIEDESEEESEPETIPTPEQKEQMLTFENVSNLSTEEYLELWKHLNPFYVTHATRQGVRDHAGMIYHTGGLGAFQSGLAAMLSDGKTLRTKAGANFGLMPGFTESDVEKALDKMVTPDMLAIMTPEQIVNQTPMNTTFASAEPWPDQQAVHFGQHTVLDDLYGGESDNEVFLVFPTDIIASQCKFGGHMNSLITAQVKTERKWNDIFVWPKDGKIPLDAGLVFLPKSQKVDRRTGSKYSTMEQIDENGEAVLVPAKDEERIKRFKEWFSGTTMESPEVAAIKQNGDNSLLIKKLREIGIPEKCFEEMAEFGNEYTFMKAVEDKKFGFMYLPSEEDQEHMTPDEIADYSIRAYLSSRHADLKDADDAISAQEYWEQYFTEHPDEKPAHVVYYDGDPSTAVKEFLESHGILQEKKRFDSRGFYDDEQSITGPGDSSERDGKMLGFDEHYVETEEKDEEMLSEHRRFNELALKILREKKAALN